MRAVLTIDELATRYHALPSQILSSADSFDIFVLNTAARYAAYRREQEENKASGKVTLTKEQEKMYAEKIKKRREKK